MKNLTVYVTSLATNQTSSLGTVYALDAATGRPAGPIPPETREVEPGGGGGHRLRRQRHQRYTRWTPGRKHQARRSRKVGAVYQFPHIDPRHRLEARP